MRVKVTISDMHGDENRSKVFEFTDYGELNRLVNEFEEETTFTRLDVQIEPAGDEELDQDAVDLIENGNFTRSQNVTRLKFGRNWIEVDATSIGGAIHSNLKEGCEKPPETCIGCAAIDGLESLILAHACAGIDIAADAYKGGIQTALDAIGNSD